MEKKGHEIDRHKIDRTEKTVGTIETTETAQIAETAKIAKTTETVQTTETVKPTEKAVGATAIMDQNDKKEKLDETEAIQTEGADFDFMKEKIKERPINKKKLVRRTIITASMAVVFGLVACLTFLVLEPVISNWLYPEEEPSVVSFPEEEEEMLPEDMLQEKTEGADEEMTESPEDVTEGANTGGAEVSVTNGGLDESAEDSMADMKIEEYQQIYTSLYHVVERVNKSMVTVVGVTSDVNWFNNTYESEGLTSGVIVADNGKELLILINQDRIMQAEEITVNFSDGSTAPAAIKEYDKNTNLAILAVPLEEIAGLTKENLEIAKLGTSNVTNTVGTPVIALGNPLDSSNNSVMYGMISATGSQINAVDAVYKKITTDIFGSQSASGVLVNLKGQVVGIISQEYNSDDTKNLISAIGISELKRTIERLSNGRKSMYLGLYITDVTKEIHEDFGVPFGEYVTGVEMDSPGMQYGIQTGDIIIGIGDSIIDTSGKYISALNQYQEGDVVAITLMRMSKEGYTEVTIEVPLRVHQ